jgi:hypothetical protein
MKKLLSTFEVSEILGISRETLQKARSCRNPYTGKKQEYSKTCDGKNLETIPFCHIGSRVFYFQDDILKYIKNIKKK